MSYAERVKRDGPLVFWRLEESSGTTATDASDNGNDGTWSAEPTWGVTGAIGNAVEAASGQYIQLSAGPDPVADWAIEGWFNAGGSWPSTRATIGAAVDASTAGEYLDLAIDSGKLVHSRGAATSGDSISVDLSSYDASAWHHAVLRQTRVDATTVEVEVWLDGTLVGSASGDWADASLPWEFGGVGGGGSPWNRQLDELAVFIYAVTPQQIRRHYWAGKGYAGYALEVLASSPLAYWRFEETSGTSLIDETGNGHDAGTINNPDLSITGRVESGIDFPSDSDYAEADTIGSFGSSLGNATIELWVAWSHSESGEAPCGALGSNTGAYMALNWNENVNGDAGNVMFFVRDDDSNNVIAAFSNNPGLNDGSWHHIVLVNEDPPNNVLRAFVDGQEKTLSYGKQQSPSNFGDLSANWYIGGRNDGGNFTLSATCSVDEHVLYGRLLSDKEIRRHYELGLAKNSYRIESISSLPLAYWKLDETSGSTATDETANANDATYVGSPTLGDTALITENQAVTFGAAGDRIEFPALGVLDGSQAFSIEGWVSADDLTGNPSVFNAWAERAVMLQLNNSGNSELEATASVGGTAVAIATSALSTGTTYYVALTYDPTDGWALYLDGALVGTDATTGTIDSKALTSNTIGEASNGTQTFLGTVDEWAVYDRALTQSEIIRHYYVGLLGPVLATILFLEGVATNESDGSALDATVRAYRWSDGRLLKTTTSDPSTGAYRIEEIENTDLLVVMQPPSGLRPLAHGPLKPDEETA